ncbi:hypothetical protein [Streptomyces sp. NPDC021020]|uniref:hypothetical protein n=1 Tax=Streptomyces sp. NPDC021020 TaxID=3365109 RepID=UPI00379B8864
MELYDGLNAGPRVAVSGALRLARMLPVLEALGTPFLGELDAVVTACGAAESSPGFESVAGKLRRWSDDLSGGVDVFLPDYYRATALAVALLVAAPGGLSPSEVFGKINANTGNFWNCCDNIVHKGGGFRDPALRSIKTTLRGVENAWFERDSQLLRQSGEPRHVLRARLREIEEKAPTRRAMAREFVICAGWDGIDFR